MSIQVRSPLKWIEQRERMDYVLSLFHLGMFSIDEDGRIWRNAVFTHQRKLLPIVPRRAESIKSKGYLALTLQMPSGKISSTMAHRIIWEWANGAIPKGMEINHKDLDKRNNRLDNLELLTPLENMQHSFAHDRIPAWSYLKQQEQALWRQNRVLLNNDQKDEICTLRGIGKPLKEIMASCHLGANEAFTGAM